MAEIVYVDRITRNLERETVYGAMFINLLYGTGGLSRFLSLLVLPLIARISFFSKLYGFLQKSPLSRWKVKPFIRKFEVDTSEFLDPVDSFASFNDFFIRKLKKQARPFAAGEDVAIMPADARYLVYQNIAAADGFLVKGKKFDLGQLLQNDTLKKRYENGTMVIARLCPTDYHRFHFPCDAIPGHPHLINGPLYSVNPAALKKNISILAENKRILTSLETGRFGTIIYIDVGATYVGSIHQVFTPGKQYKKGDEKGYFSFGGSSLILLFEPDRIRLDQDLIDASLGKMEMKGLLGQSLGRALSK